MLQVIQELTFERLAWLAVAALLILILASR